MALDPEKHEDANINTWISERSGRIFGLRITPTTKDDLVAATIKHIPNPREENEEHRYNLASTKFRRLGMNSINTLGDHLLDEIQNVVTTNLHRIDKSCIDPKVKWGKSKNQPVTPVVGELEFS